MDIDAFRQMVTKNPKGFLGRYGLGHKILQEGGSFEEAAEHLLVAVQLDPLHVASHLALGRALIGLKKPEEAKPVLQAGIDAAISGRSTEGATSFRRCKPYFVRSDDLCPEKEDRL